MADIAASLPLGPKLPNLIKTVEHFRKAIEYLTAEQRPEIFGALIAELPNLIKTTSDFRKVFKYLAPEQRTEICKALKAELPYLINSLYDFIDVLEYLTPEQRTEIYNALKAKQPNLIKTQVALSAVLKYLTPEQGTEIIGSLKAKLPNLIKTADDFRKVLEYSTPEQRTEIYNALKTKVPNLIKTADDLRKVLEYLTPEQRTDVTELFFVVGNAHIPNLVQKMHDQFDPELYKKVKVHNRVERFNSKATLVMSIFDSMRTGSSLMPGSQQQLGYDRSLVPQSRSVTNSGGTASIAVSNTSNPSSLLETTSSFSINDDQPSLGINTDRSQIISLMSTLVRGMSTSPLTLCIQDDGHSSSTTNATTVVDEQQAPIENSRGAPSMGFVS